MISFGLAAKGEETDRLAKLVADRIWPGRGYDFGPCRAIAVVRGDQLAAGLVYHNYDDEAGVIEISGAAWIKGWLTKPVLHAMYAFAFDDCGCQAVVQRVSDDDTAQHRMLTAYGFNRYRIPRLRGRDKAENIFVLAEENWRKSRFYRSTKANQAG